MGIRTCVTLRRVLVEISVTEQRYQAVMAVLAGDPVVDVAAKVGVSRQAVHRWFASYDGRELAGVADRGAARLYRHRPRLLARLATTTRRVLVTNRFPRRVRHRRR
jgi:hypothetical protein